MQGKGVTHLLTNPPPIFDFRFWVLDSIQNQQSKIQNWMGEVKGGRIPLLPRNCRSYESRT